MAELSGTEPTPAVTSAAGYDEFGLLHENAAKAGLPFDHPPAVARHSFTVETSHQLSGILWRSAQPELVLLHGGGQNAHTWDTVALALGRPLIAIDLPATATPTGAPIATTARGGTPRRSPRCSTSCTAGGRAAAWSWSGCRSAA